MIGKIRTQLPAGQQCAAFKFIVHL